MSETYPSSPGDQSPQPKPGERCQPYDPKELLFGILRGEVSQAEARQVMEREAIDHVSGGFATVREAMEHTDGIAPDLTDQAPRRLDVAEHDDAGQAVERRYRAEDMISESDIYLRAVELDRESLQDMIQGALDSLTDGDTELRGLVEGSSRYLASKQAAEAGELIYPEHFKSQIESLIASEWSSKDYSEQKQKLLTDVSVIMHVRTLMDTMHERVDESLGSGNELGRGDLSSDMVSAEADSEPLSDVAKELAGVVEGAGARCSNEDARWIVDKLVERGWVDIAGAFHDAAQAEINSDKKARLEKSKQAFLANNNEAMRARVESALLARDVIYGSGHSDQPEA